MTDKDERMKDAVAELRFASDGIVNMLAANLTPKESFMRDLAADLSYAASAIASQAAEIAALRAEIERLKLYEDWTPDEHKRVVAQLADKAAEIAALREGLPVPPRNEYWAQGEYGHD